MSKTVERLKKKIGWIVTFSCTVALVFSIPDLAEAATLAAFSLMDCIFTFFFVLRTWFLVPNYSCKNQEKLFAVWCLSAWTYLNRFWEGLGCWHFILLSWELNHVFTDVSWPPWYVESASAVGGVIRSRKIRLVTVAATRTRINRGNVIGICNSSGLLRGYCLTLVLCPRQWAFSKFWFQFSVLAIDN